MNNITFESPYYLYLLLLIPGITVFYIFRQQKTNASFRLSSIDGTNAMPLSFRHYLRHILFAFRVIAIGLLVIILARPQSTDSWQDISAEGIDIILAMDISGSMLARDFKPDRLEAAKDVATEFISGRPNDRIGLVIFSGESFTQCPLTTDHAILINLLREMESGMIEDGTAIGLGLATAINRIKDSEAKSKTIILLTDGVNNRGAIAPLTAAEIAKTFGLRVYTIGVGSQGMAPYPIQTSSGTRFQNMPVEIDEEVLKKIADMTGGKYFRATDNQGLVKIYSEIDALEKSKISVQEYNKKKEEYLLLGKFLIMLLLIEVITKNTILRRVI